MNKSIFYAAAFAATIFGSSVESFCSDNGESMEVLNGTEDRESREDKTFPACFALIGKELPEVQEMDVPGKLRSKLNPMIQQIKGIDKDNMEYVKGLGHLGSILLKWKRNMETPNNSESLKNDIANTIFYFANNIEMRLTFTKFDQITADILRQTNPEFWTIIALLNMAKEAIVSVMHFVQPEGEWQKGEWNTVEEPLEYLKNVEKAANKYLEGQTNVDETLLTPFLLKRQALPEVEKNYVPRGLLSCLNLLIEEIQGINEDNFKYVKGLGELGDILLK